MAYTDQPWASLPGQALQPSPLSSPSHTPALPVPYSDRSPRISSEAGPSSQAPASQGSGLPAASSPYGGAAAAFAAAAAAPAVADPTGESSPPARARLQRLKDGDSLWMWKLGLRALLLIAAVIGIAGTAVVTSHGTHSDRYDGSLVPYALIPFAVSFVWCAVVILIPVLSRQGYPVFPGFVVAFDLIIWLGTIASLMVALYGYFSLLDDQEETVLPVPVYDGKFSYYSDPGGYALDPNGTWIYTSSLRYDYYNYVVKATTPATADASATVVEVSATATGVVTGAGTASATPNSAATATAATITSAPAVQRRLISVLHETVSPSTSTLVVMSYAHPHLESPDPDPADEPSNTYEDEYGGQTFTDRYIDYTNGVAETRTILYLYGDGFLTTLPVGGATAASATGTATTASPTPRVCSSAFASCAAQDTYVNRLFHSFAGDTALALMVVVLLGVLILLHFVLFVWGCVDTNRYNRRAVYRDAFDLNSAGGIALLETLRQRGYVMVPAESLHAGGGGSGGLAVPLAPGMTTTAAEKAPAAGFPRYQ